MEWNAAQIGRMYTLYEAHVGRLRAEVNAVNATLGFPKQESCKLELLTLDEFRAVLQNPGTDREIVDRWVKRILRGHESEFSVLQAAG